MDKESARIELKLRPAHWIDLIEVELYSNKDYYSYKQCDYYIWSDRKKEFEKHFTTPSLHWRDLQPYSENNLLYVCQLEEN